MFYILSALSETNGCILGDKRWTSDSEGRLSRWRFRVRAENNEGD